MFADSWTWWTLERSASVDAQRGMPGAVRARSPVSGDIPPGLLQAGYAPVSFADVDAALSGLRDVLPGCLVLSLDDALASQLQNAVPVLAEFRITGLFVVMPAFRDGGHQYLDAAGIRAVHDAGAHCRGAYL
jgi:hypothetical protein